MPIQSPLKSNNESLNIPSKSFVDYKRIVLGFILLLVSAGLLFLVAYPLYTNYQNNNIAIAEQKTKIEELDLRLAQLDKIKRIAGSIESTTKLTTQAVPEVDEIPVVMAMVQEISKASGVKLVDFSYAGMESSKPVVTSTPTTDTGISDPKPQPSGSVLNKQPDSAPTPITPAKGNYDIFKMQLTVKGKFDDIKKLINNLEESRRVLDIYSFGYNIQGSETQIVGDVITLKLTLASYFKKFDKITTSVNIDQYSTLIKKLESLTYTEIDLSNPNVGKIDPFSTLSGTPAPTPSGTPASVNNVEPSSFFNDKNNSSEVNVVELEGTGKIVNPTVEPDVEATPGDTTKLLQDLMKAEGL